MFDPWAQSRHQLSSTIYQNMFLAVHHHVAQPGSSDPVLRGQLHCTDGCKTKWHEMNVFPE